MSDPKPIEVAIVGGGCAAVTTAFELTRPEHHGKYHVTLYQLGWRLGGKGASGRGAGGRIEEHGFHVWMGFYENAFRLLRECYAELGRDPAKSRFADWRDAFSPSPVVGLADRSPDGSWHTWMACFPPGKGLPGDPLTEQNPFSVTGYLVRATVLLRVLLGSYESRHAAQTGARGSCPSPDRADARLEVPSVEAIGDTIGRILKYGMLATMASLIEAVGILEVLFGALPQYSESVILRLLEAIGSSARRQLEDFADEDDEVRRVWEVIDVVLATLEGIVRFGLVYDPRGFDAIDDYDWREWLRLNGASERSLNSAFVRGLHALTFAYEDGEFHRPRLAAGEALRGTLRMLFTYRGGLFWKMQGGMGDVVFGPFYEVLKRRGVRFEFFHRLENIKLVDPATLAPSERPYVAALEFDVQAEIEGGSEYRPLIDVRGLPCWPSKPDYGQLVAGDRLEREGWDFESYWDQRKVGTKTVRVVDDFDFVVLGVGLGAIPHVCREIVARDRRWRAMVQQVKTVATQSFQVWLRDGLDDLGWAHALSSFSAFAQPFDTWADMRHLLAEEESWPTPPRGLAYACSVLPDPPAPPDRADVDYPSRRHAEVRRNAIRFMNSDISQLWPNAVRSPGCFRWELLVDPATRHGTTNDAEADETRFDSQFWRANVNPSDRYTLALPGSARHRISPLDNTYDNLTIAGDWTHCGDNTGCVEAAVMSGRLAAHAIAHLPRLEDIIGYDHP
jgi:uncharacterized protein with NAD-binding domain and iron-sulfur cluster